MPCSAQLYPVVLTWLQAVGLTPHRTSQRAVAALTTALLLGQSLHPAALLRALPSSPAVPARQRYKRLARLLDSPALTPAVTTAALVRGSLRLFPPQAPTLALDTVRCGGWESITVGLVLEGRVQLLSAAVLPVPWPKGRFWPTVLHALQQVHDAWPPDAPAPHLVADRFFPCQQLFARLAQWDWGFTLRLRATQTVTVDGTPQRVRARLATAVPEAWTRVPAAYGQGRAAPAGQFVVGQGLVVLPWHQRDAASARARQRRARQRVHDRKQTRHPGVAQTDAWVALFSSEATTLGAVRRYRQRYTIEGTYRDLQGGWDGQHGWDFEVVATAQPAAAHVVALLGLAALAHLLQQWLGSQLGHTHSSGAGRWQHLAWTVHGRLSLFTRGRFALTDPSGHLDDWLRTTLAAGTARLTCPWPVAAAPPRTLPAAA